MARGGFPRGGFPGGGMGNMQQMLKQAQKMQQDMAKAQEELAQAEIEASAGGGMVTVTVTGDKQLKSIVIKPEAVDPVDVEMLQDLVLAAVNEALRQMDELTQEKMGKVTGGMGGIPGLF